MATPELPASPVRRRPTRRRPRWSGASTASPTANSTRRVNRLARVLRAHGVGPDAPAATVLGNRPEWVEVALATARLGARLVPASWRSTTDELDYLVNDSRAVLLVSEPSVRADDVGPTLHVGDEYERAIADQSDAAIPGASTPDYFAARRLHLGHDRPAQGDRASRRRRALDPRRAPEHVAARLLGPHRCRRGEPHEPPAPPRRGARLRHAGARRRRRPSSSWSDSTPKHSFVSSRPSGSRT